MKKMNVISYAFSHVIKFPMVFVSGILVILCFIFETTGLPYISQQISNLLFNTCNQQEIYAKMPYFLFLAFLGNFVVGVIYRFEAYFLENRATAGIRRSVQLDLEEVLIKKNYSYHSSQTPGDLITKVNYVIDGAPEMVRILVSHVVKVIFGTILTGFIVATVHKFFLFTLMLNMTLFVLVSFLLKDVFAQRAANFFHNYSKVAGSITDLLSCIETFKMFSTYKQQMNLFRSYAKDLFDTEVRFRTSIFLSFTSLWVIYLCISSANLYMLFYLLKQGKITPGDFLLIIGTSWSTISWLFYAVYNLGRVTQYYGQISQALDGIYNTGEDDDQPQSRKFEIQKGDIAFENVCFEYTNGVEVLHNLSFKIAQGEKIGIVGPSGSGKSTILKLISKLYAVSSGKILVDDTNINLINRESLINKLTWVPQDSILLNRSIRDNLCFEHGCEEKMKKLCKSFGLDGIIKKMGGYDTIIGQGGDRLSGGQEQRLCAVRALCRDFKILLLDEPTANLDEQNAEQVFKEIIRSVDEYKTVVAVAHSAKLIEKMDRVLVIIDGKLVEDGSPKVLGKDKNSEYYKIFNTNANQE